MRWQVVVVALAFFGMSLAGCLNASEPADAGGDDTETVVGSIPVAFGPGGNGTPDRPGVPRYVYTGWTGAEPNIGITSSGSIFMTAFDETIRSTDGGHTWESVFTYDIIQGQVPFGTSDPMLWVDTITDRVYTNHMVGTQCFEMIWSDDDGDSWFQRDLACMIPDVDHQKVMTAPAGPDLNPQAVRLDAPGNYPNVLYTCYNAALGTQCFASFDGGYTYTQETVALSDEEGPCHGVNGHPAATADGIVAVAAGWNCGPVVAHTRDSGLTWTAYLGPQEFGVGASIDPDLTFTSDGNMYLFYRDEDHMARLARSPDFGATWDEVWNITAPGLTSTRFHVMSSGADGRLAMAYLGTEFSRGHQWEFEGEVQTWDGAPTEAPPNATWHLYIVTAEEADTDTPRFTSYQVTPDDDPVQVGCTWEGGGGGGPRSCRNMLDFIDSAMHPDGTFYVTYTEGCTLRLTCAPVDAASPPDEMDSRDREVAVAWLDGWSLLG